MLRCRQSRNEDFPDVAAFRVVDEVAQSNARAEALMSSQFGKMTNVV